MDGFIILAVIVITIILVLIVVALRRVNKGVIGTTCDRSNPCALGNVCDNGICKAADGSICSSDSDCSSTSRCTNNVCTSTVTATTTTTTATPTVTSTNFVPMPSGNTKFNVIGSSASESCSMSESVSEEQYTSTYNDSPFDSNTRDAVYIKDTLYILTWSGDIISNGRVMYPSHSFDDNPTHIFVHGRGLYTVSGGIIYDLRSGIIPLNILKRIIHVSCIRDDTHIWVQTDKYGIIYNNEWKVVSKINISNGTIRKYGFSVNVYVNINVRDRTAYLVINNKMTKISNVATADFDRNGDLIYCTSNEIPSGRGLKYLNQKLILMYTDEYAEYTAISISS